jgi:hypothetical protein
MSARSFLFCLVVLAGTLGTSFLRAAEPESIVLFNGENLQGWVVEGAQHSKDKDGSLVPLWSVRNGLLHCTGKGYGFLRYDVREFSDFVFHMEYRLSKGCNSGIGFRTPKYTGKSNTRPSFASYEIQVLDDAGKTPTDHTSGSLYRYRAAQENATLPTGEWNVMEVHCRGPHIRITLNGKVLHDIDQSQIENLKNKPLSGYVCVQSHGKEVEFRNLRVQDLAATSSK